jgi:hypothetical protein
VTFSEKYHFTAIEILCAFVEDCPLMNHLIWSYQKNYFPSLEPIVSLIQPSLKRRKGVD